MNRHEIGDAAWSETTTPPVEWSSGPWRLELRDDEIADVTYDGRRVLRSIRGVARDQDWGTIPPVVTSVSSSPTDLVVEVSLADLAARLVVSLVYGDLDIRWQSVAHADFLRARLGLVVLHPPTLAGETLAITHTDGSIEKSAYPLAISPHQPAFDVRELAWRHEGVQTSLHFEGDVFEMEDQRNWTDASFKTYSTPLSVPFPVLVEAGTTVSQGIHVASAALSPAAPASSNTRIELVDARREFPAIGTSATTAPAVAPALPRGSFLLVELPAHTPVWREVLDRAVAEAGGLPLDVRIVGAADVTEVLAALEPLQVVRVGVFSADTHVSEPSLWESLATDLPRVGGTRAHFTELNRTLDRLPRDIPAYTFSVTPQMHATGREQIVESIAMQRLVASQAVALTGAPVHVGPVTLRSRFNAVATSTTPDALVTSLDDGYNAAVTPDATDPRQSSTAVAAWTIASAAALAIDGVESITWFEASGPRGVDGLPVGEAIDAIAELAGRPMLFAPDAPADVWAVGAGSVVLVANLRAEAVTVRIVTPFGERDVALDPFAWSRLDF